MSLRRWQWMVSSWDRLASTPLNCQRCHGNGLHYILSDFAPKYRIRRNRLLSLVWRWWCIVGLVRHFRSTIRNFFVSFTSSISLIHFVRVCIQSGYFTHLSVYSLYNIHACLQRCQIIFISWKWSGNAVDKLHQINFWQTLVITIACYIPTLHFCDLCTSSWCKIEKDKWKICIAVLRRNIKKSFCVFCIQNTQAHTGLMLELFAYLDANVHRNESNSTASTVRSHSLSPPNIFTMGSLDAFRRKMQRRISWNFR